MLAVQFLSVHRALQVFMEWVSLVAVLVEQLLETALVQVEQ